MCIWCYFFSVTVVVIGAVSTGVAFVPTFVPGPITQVSSTATTSGSKDVYFCEETNCIEFSTRLVAFCDDNLNNY